MKGGDARAAYREAVTAAEGGDFARAEALYRLCLDRDADHVEALHDLGVLAARRGADGEAAAHFEAAARLRPTYAEAHANLCLLHANRGRLDEAVLAGRTAVALKPGLANAHSNLGNALEAKGEFGAALEAYGRAADLDPRFGAVYIKIADILNRQGNSAAALDFADKGIRLHPGLDHDVARSNRSSDIVIDSNKIEHDADRKPVPTFRHHALAEAFRTRGVIQADLGRTEAAWEDFRRALALDPSSATHHVNAASLLIDAGRPEEAEALLRRAIELDAGHADAYGNLGTALLKQGLRRPAFDAYHRAVTLNPRYALAYGNLCGLLRDIGELEAAVSMADLAIALLPGHSGAYVNVAGALRQLGRQADAIAAYRRALALDPRLGDVRVELCYYRAQACDWAGLAEEQEAAMAATFRAGRRVPPFPVMTFDPTPADQRLAARVWAAGFAAGPPLAAYRPRPAGTRGRRLRVGYLSADFHNHATALLIAELFERHDKARFEVFGYSIGRDDDGPVRRRLVAAFDHFIELAALSHREAARAIHADEIDILIDLKGYTEGARSEITACRPAPIQVNFLGFPASMGAPFIDYVIADPIVAPEGAGGEFDERIVRLPDCYQPNDRRRPIAERPSRAACGLPETGFVFCSFNNTYKITPAVFDTWMRLLARTPGAVLWLLDAAEGVAGNLRREAEARGLDPARLVFAPRIAVPRHLARLALADLFLDTLPVNAHTTASEALWAGLPLITCVGRTFAGRVAASLLHAVGLPDLVTRSLGEYEALALDLAHRPGRLEALRARLDANRLTAPLFDTERYARHFEAALLAMEALRDAGRPPEDLTVAPARGEDRGTARLLRPRQRFVTGYGVAAACLTTEWLQKARGLLRGPGRSPGRGSSPRRHRMRNQGFFRAPP